MPGACGGRQVQTGLLLNISFSIKDAWSAESSCSKTALLCCEENLEEDWDAVIYVKYAHVHHLSRIVSPDRVIFVVIKLFKNTREYFLCQTFRSVIKGICVLNFNAREHGEDWAHEEQRRRGVLIFILLWLGHHTHRLNSDLKQEK